MKLICVKTFGVYENITIGKEYYVLKTEIIPSYGDINGATYYTIKNDINEFGGYESGCFKNLKQERRKKLDKIWR